MPAESAACLKARYSDSETRTCKSLFRISDLFLFGRATFSLQWFLLITYTLRVKRPLGKRCMRNSFEIGISCANFVFALFGPATSLSECFDFAIETMIHGFCMQFHNHNAQKPGETERQQHSCCIFW